MKTFSAAIAAIALLSAPVAAVAGTQARESVSVAVATQGLDLSRSDHVSRLRTRVARAIAKACNPGDRIGADLSPDWRCRHEMGANAEIAMNRLITAPQSRVASN